MTRFRVFVDYWNFRLTIQGKEGRELNIQNHRFNINWRDLGLLLAKKACATTNTNINDFSYEGVGIYTSYNPRDKDLKFHDFVHNTLNRFPGISVTCAERRPKGFPKCPTCHQEIKHCPNCNARIVATEEKGVDTLLVTDMIRLAWENAYDFAVLASQDSDLVPAVKFLHQKGQKIIHAAFPPQGRDLTNACWAHFDVYQLKEQIRR